MEPTDNKTISAELLRYLKQENLTISFFADKSGINSGTLSRIINGQQTISVSSLDLITKAMNLEKGHFYSLYATESCSLSSLDWRRLGPFIQSCAELGKLQIVDQVVSLMMDSLSYASHLFDCAEHLFEEGYKDAAVIIYRKVAESERYQHAERLALCQYRIFTCSLTKNQEHNLECALQLESYILRLGEAEQLDALKDLANLFLSLRKWTKARYYAKLMGHVSKNLYEQKVNRKSQRKKTIEPAKPLFGYILYANLMLGAISAEEADYEKALYYVSSYEDLSWVVETDEESEQTKKQFKDWAIGNKYLYQLMSGRTDVLEEYVDYVSVRKNEVLMALFKIVQAANIYRFDIDKYLERFKNIIMDQLERSETVGSYTTQFFDDRFANFLTDVGLYYLRRNNIHNGVRYILDSLAVSYKINNTANIVRCCSTIEKIRSQIDYSDLQKYAAFMKEVYDQDEEKVSVTVVNC
ncbi:helix-turn-helix domain-containing protein [Paenibacillus glucanolyticus]|uniref:helix-turn-helix domain-containing protein n=1 Tax=Paenibacillus glucanolyticus TaxID=59843 RepID=UPI0034CD3C7F